MAAALLAFNFRGAPRAGAAPRQHARPASWRARQADAQLAAEEAAEAQGA
jgi:hypothetical protein